MDKRVQSINSDRLRPLVCAALANQTAEIASWQINEIHGGTGGAIGGTALYRVHGQTTQNEPWTLVLKILYARPGEMIGSPYYWKREYELYRSGMLDQLPETGLLPPVFYGFEDFSDSCWIWMADIQVAKSQWSLDDYRTISRRLGRFNGAYLTGLQLPEYSWLSDSWHCRIVPPLAETFERLDEFLKRPLIQRTLPLSEKETILAIWQDAEQFCDALTSLPQTLCHLDAFHGNLFHTTESTILIDWALAGRGAIGEELTAMVSLPLFYPGFPMAQANALDKVIFEGYVDGLRDAGWQGDSRLARLGYTCAMVLRGLAGVEQDIKRLLDENNFSELQRAYGDEKIEEVADRYAAVRRFRLIQMAEEARQLL